MVKRSSRADYLDPKLRTVESLACCNGKTSVYLAHHGDCTKILDSNPIQPPLENTLIHAHKLRSDAVPESTVIGTLGSCLPGSQESFCRVRVEKMSHLRLAGHVTVDALLHFTIRFCLALVLTKMFCPRMH